MAGVLVLLSARMKLMVAVVLELFGGCSLLVLMLLGACAILLVVVPGLVAVGEAPVVSLQPLLEPRGTRAILIRPLLQFLIGWT